MTTAAASKAQQRGKRMVDAVARYVDRAVKPLVDKLVEHGKRQQSTDQLVADLEARIAALENRHE